MLAKQQFSLGYLMLEIFWVAAALGFFRAAFSQNTIPYVATSVFLFIGVTATGAAIGGLFGRMANGAYCVFGCGAGPAWSFRRHQRLTSKTEYCTNDSGIPSAFSARLRFRSPNYSFATFAPLRDLCVKHKNPSLRDCSPVSKAAQIHSESQLFSSIN
ncbi:MAG TPA: hypothetical protein VGI40_05890 [Pirellulaceae bacterium]|jgi:hypothetical protein